ncbi:MAG: hypothetical protein PF961_17235 [Planctomycetota bacterium]|jgi:hypothetical protein|nr:hypothetical protein [Planctomycetota bacterium]
MRTALLLCILSLSLPALEGLVYLDPALSGPVRYSRVLVYFCETCPSARKMMAGSVKELAEAIQAQHAPIQLICVTPGLSGEALQAYATSVGIDTKTVGFAQDPANKLNISLQNIYQTRLYSPGTSDGKSVALNKLLATINDPQGKMSLGSYVVEPGSISDPQLIELWWAIERGVPGALGALAKNAKRAKPDDERGAQILALYESISTKLLATVDEAMAAGDDFAAYEQLEAALIAADGLDTKDATKKLKTMSKDKVIKNELKARNAYQKCQLMLASPKEKERLQAAAGLKQLADKMGDTVYGAKAAQ